MRKILAVLGLSAWVIAAPGVGAASASFICKPNTASKGALIRTLQEERPGLFGKVTSMIRISYIGINDAGIPEFRETRTIFRPLTKETFWKDDGISHRSRVYEIGMSETRVIDRTMIARPLSLLSLRVIAVTDDGDLRYRLEPPDGCE